MDAARRQITIRRRRRQDGAADVPGVVTGAPQPGTWSRFGWIALTAIGVAVLVLGTWGGRGSAYDRVMDALRLFSSGFPGAPEEDYAWQFDVARTLAPLVTVYATFRLVGTLLAERIIRLRARLRRDHAVVVGLGAAGVGAVRALRAAGAQVTALDLAPRGDGATAARAAGALVVGGDATQAAVLHDVALARAERVVCTLGDDAAATRVAALAATIARGRARPLALHLRLADVDLREAIGASAADIGSLRLRFLDVDAPWAASLVDAVPELELDAPEPPTIAIVGDGPTADAVVVELARRRLAARAAGPPVVIRLVGEDAPGRAAALEARYTALAFGAALEPLALADAALIARALAPGTCAAIVCGSEPSRTAATALALARRLGETPIAAALPDGGRALHGLVPEASFRLRAVPSPAAGWRLDDLEHDPARLAIARAAHAAWSRGRGGPDASTPAWAALDDAGRRANLEHADGVLDQLRAVLLRPVPRLDWSTAPRPLSESAVETMAALEHERWRRARRAAGWAHGAARDDAERRHPDLVPWAELPEERREVNRSLVRARPDALAAAGLDVEVAPARDAIARGVHAAWRELFGAGAADAPWERLPDARRSRPRAFADGIPAKLLLLGRRLVPADAPGAEGLVLAAAAIERLATEEHARWVAERVAEGWQVGPRDDDARRHPDLVPWEELGEPTREIDRQLVARLPALLRGAGLATTSL